MHTLRQAVGDALRARGLEISFAHFATLFSLSSESGMTGAQLARRAMCSAQTMNSILRRLEAEGLIERGPHPESRRADSWSLTDEGADQLARARVVSDAVFSRMLSALDPDEITELQSYLRRCIAALPSGPARTEAGEPATERRPRVPRGSRARRVNALSDKPSA
jgi:DNA-binding MarR family transcriptional regulator